jgi:cation transport ATPase
MTSIVSQSSLDRPVRRTPWTVRVAAAIVLLLAVVTSYGAIYFSFYFQDPEVGLGSYAFVAAFLAINVTAAAAAASLLRGSSTGWRVLVGYGVLGIVWCIAKLVFWQEEEAMLFGAANVAYLVLLMARRTRQHLG